MNTMILITMVAVAVGLFADRLGGREMKLATVAAVALTLLYYFRPSYMT